MLHCICDICDFQDGCTALMVHGETGNVDVVLRLIEAQAFMDTQDKVCE